MAVGLILFIGIAINVSTPGGDAQAVSCGPTRAHCNDDEERAYDVCRSRTGSGRVVQGAIWFNNSSNAATSDGYYALGVNIAADQTSVDVSIRGSVYSCANLNNNRGAIYAIRIRPDSIGGAYPDSGRLRVNNTVLNRGTFTGAAYQWTSRGSSASATLNVAGLATNNTGSSATQTINVGVYRCQSSNGRDQTGTCDTAVIPVRITRAQRPAHELTPTVSVTPSYGESQQPLEVTPRVRTTPGGTIPNVNWQLTKFTVLPGEGYPTTQTENTRTPSVHYGSDFPPVAQGTGTFTGNRTLPVSNDTLADLPVGSLQCYALSVNPYTNRSGVTGWRHGVPACTAIAVRPLVQVLGGDLIVGRGVGANPSKVSRVSTSTKLESSTGLHFGSWAEYGIIPTGTVIGMGSGAAYAGGNATNEICAVSVLTFANNTGSSCTATRVGEFDTRTSAPNIASRFIANSPAPLNAAAVNLYALSPSVIYSSNRPAFSVSSSAVFGVGRWVVINAPSSTITITGNLSYTDAPLRGTNEIPQIVIIANNIIIADGVTNVDAWLVATGTGANGRINTCGAGSGITETTLPNADQCNQRLTVNGPVVANHLIMRRTAGGDENAQPGDPAEVFNLRADAYLWASGYSSGTGRIPTVDVKELPPRF